MFLIRTAFWVGLVILLLPTDKQQQAKLYSSARAAIHHVSTFCDRNAGLCAQGARQWATFQTKLEFGTKLAVDLVAERLTGAPLGAPQPAVDRGTLTPADTTPAWRAHRNGA